MPKAVKVATRYCRDLTLAVLPSLRSIFMDVAGFIRSGKRGDASAASATEATQTLVSTEGSRDKDDGAFDGSAFATMALVPALAPRPSPRRIIRRRRRQIVNRKSRFIAMIEAALAKKAATPASKSESSSQPSKFVGGKADSRASRRLPRSGTPGSKPAADFIGFVVGGLSKFSRAPPKPGGGNRPARKSDPDKIMRDFNHIPKPPKRR